MRECGLVRTAKRTLCGLILSILGITAGITAISCSARPPEPVPEYKVKKIRNEALEEVLKYSIDGEYAKVRGFFKQRYQHLLTEREAQLINMRQTNSLADLPMPSFSLSEKTLEAIAMARTRDYSSAETQFRNIMEEFKQKPHLVEDVQKELATYFASKEYEESEKLLSGASSFYPQLTAVMGFMYVAKKDFAKAREWLSKAVPLFEENTVYEYRNAFGKLLAHTKKEHRDDKLTLEYAKILGALYNAKPKPPATIKSVDEQECVRRGLCRLLAFVCKKQESETDAHTKKEYDSIILETAGIIADSYEFDRIHSEEEAKK